MCLYYFSSVWVAEWPPFGKQLLTLLTICSLCILTICNISYFPFGFEGWIGVLIASDPDLCIKFTSSFFCSQHIKLLCSGYDIPS